MFLCGLKKSGKSGKSESPEVGKSVVGSPETGDRRLIPSSGGVAAGILFYGLTKIIFPQPEWVILSPKVRELVEGINQSTPPTVQFPSVYDYQQTQTKKTGECQSLKLWCGPESNRRHKDFQSLIYWFNMVLFGTK